MITGAPLDDSVTSLEEEECKGGCEFMSLLTLGERLLGGLVLMLALGLLAFGGYQLNHEQQRNAFDAAATTAASEFDAALDELDTLAVTLKGLHQAGSDADGLTADLLAKHPAVTSLGRYASVDAARREAFERNSVDNGLYRFGITEIDTEGHAHPRGETSRYRPISRLEPMDPARLRLLGADLNTVDGMDKALERIAATDGSLAATLPAHWPTGNDFLLLHPTYRGSHAPSDLAERLRQTDGGYWLAIDPVALLAGFRTRLARFDATLRMTESIGGDRVLFTSEADDAGTHVLEALYPRRTLAQRHTFRQGELVLTLAGDIGVPPGFLTVMIAIALLIVFTSVVIVRAVRDKRRARREQREHQLAAHRERERADRTLNSIDDAVFALDLEHRVSYLNPAAARLAGDTRPDVLHRPFGTVLNLHHEGTNRTLDLVEMFAAIAHGGPRATDVSLHAAPADDGRGEGDDATDGYSEDSLPQVLRLAISRTRDTDDRVSGYILVLRDISDERGLTRRLEYQANHDALTGCTNRRWFEQRLGELIDDLPKSGRRHALCYLDLDQFKIVNDTNGHAAGDRLLQELTVKLQQVCREGDVLSRLGGDEFGLLVIDADEDAARAAAERIYGFFQSYVFRHGDDTFAVRASIGLVPLDAQSGTIGDVLAAADLACYAAKENGRNQLCVYDADDEALTQRSNELNRLPELQRAIARDRFELHVQAVASLARPAPSLDVTHFEFLLRLTGEDGRPVTPFRIIEAAERYGLMRQIDRWVISHALACVAALGEGPGRQCSFSINLSGQSATDPTLIEFIEGEYARHEIEPSRIWFELTETAAISHFSIAVDLATRIRALGSKVALDDFGSGLSSFGYLKNIPVDVLKIDGQFVRHIVDDPVDRTMVRAIDEVGKSMGITTVAEFVEDEAIVEVLREIGIDYAQGYHVGKPCPLPEALAALAALEPPARSAA